MPIPAFIIDTMRQAPRLYEMTVEEVRQVFIDQGKAAPPLPYAGQIEERTLTTAHRETPVRIYRMTEDEAAPVLVYFHGGGMLFGDLNFMDAPCRYISEHACCTVISVDYALAPENKFPKPLEECYEAVREIVRNAAELKIDPARLALGGDSAGGNLTATVSMLARERKEFSIVRQVLLYPWIDLATDPDLKENETNDLPLNAGDFKLLNEVYLNDPEEAKLPLVSPVYAEDLAGLPPAVVITEGNDPLKEEGMTYAGRLAEAGVPVAHMHFDDMIHGFIQFTGVVEEATEALDFVCEILKEDFSK